VAYKPSGKGRGLGMNRGQTAAAALAVIALSGASHAETSEAARAEQAQPEGVVLTSDCLEHQAFIDGDADAVEQALPSQYSPARNPSSSLPLLFVRALRCNVNERSTPTTFGSFGVVVESPDGTTCSPSSVADVPAVCNWYVLSWVADEPGLIRWLRKDAPDFPATYVPHLTLEQAGIDASKGGAPFRFEAAAPAPAPFAMDAVTRERPGEIRVRGAYWNEVQEGTVRVGFATDDLRSGDATGVVTAPKHSLLARLMGAEEAPYELGYSGIAAERWSSGHYRKQVTGSRGGTRFEGSCSLKGTVHFKPGATLLVQQLHYRFNGEGRCTGKLNGDDVEEVAVASRMFGNAKGSCVRAETTEPGSGVLRFPGGRELTYNLDFTYLTPETDFTWYGSRSGRARGTGTFRTDRTPPDTTARCATPEGAIDVPMDITVKTETPMVGR
jgi:hypothetical protein